MLSNIITNWAKSFYYASMQIPIDLNFQFSENEEESITEFYNTEFLAPMTEIVEAYTGKTADQLLINSCLEAIKSSGLPNALHYLKELSKVCNIVRSSDENACLPKAIEYFKSNTKEVYIITPKSTKPVIGFTDKSNRLLGTFIQTPIVLAETRRFPRGLDIENLCTQNPINLTDFGTQVLKKLIDCGYLHEEKLNRTNYIIPCVDGTFKELSVNAVNPMLPSYFVRKLIGELPEATIKDAQSPYHAALEYAEQHPEDCRTALPELRQIIDSIATDKATGLTDEIVMKYLHDKYGIPIKELKDAIMVPTTEKLYTSAYFLGKGAHNMTAEELISKAAEDPLSVSGTLDELILAYCEEEEFDTNLTVKQLIKFINEYSTICNPSNEEILRSNISMYLMESFISRQTTLEEFVDGIEHREPNKAEEALKFLDSVSSISTEMKSDINKAILEGKELKHISLEDTLSELGVDADISDAILNAKNSGTKFTKPAIDDDELIDYLVTLGINKHDARNITLGVLPSKESDDSAKEIHDFLLFHYPEEVVQNIMTGNLPASKELDDKGYMAANSLLYNIRQAMLINDSNELRSSVLPILYSYLRILMMRKGDEEDVISFLEDKKKECTGVSIDFMNEAIEKLK